MAITRKVPSESKRAVESEELRAVSKASLRWRGQWYVNSEALVDAFLKNTGREGLEGKLGGGEENSNRGTVGTGF